MKHLSFLLFTLLFVLLTACEKERLPKPTEEGKNTFGCEVDGKVFLPKSSGLFSGDLINVYNFSDYGFTLSARRYDETSKLYYDVTIALPYLTKTGVYQLKTYPYGIYERRINVGPIYKTNSAHTGTVNITRCDIVNHIYSGTFSFTAVDDSSGKTVKITKGRFDVQWHR